MEPNRFLIRIALCFLVATVFWILPPQAYSQCGTTAATGSMSWSTSWCDEFNGAANSPISSANWTYDTGAGGWGNNELETYCAPTSNTSPCSTSTPNAYSDGSGHLAIKVYSPTAAARSSSRSPEFRS